MRELTNDDFNPESTITRIARSNGYLGLYPDTKETIISQQIINIPPDAIRSVIIGAMSRRQTSYEQVDGLEEAAWRIILEDKALSHVKVERAFIDHEKYAVNIVDTQNLDSLKDHVHPQEMTFYRCGMQGRGCVESDIKAGNLGISPF